MYISVLLVSVVLETETECPFSSTRRIKPTILKTACESLRERPRYNAALFVRVILLSCRQSR